MSEWKKIKLKEILKEVSERNKGEKVKRVLSVTNSQGFVDQEEYFEGTVHSTNISNYKIIRKNQFAYNPSRVNVGSIDILKKYDEGAISPMYVIFEVDETRILPEYFMFYFQTHRFFENVKNNTQGSVRNSLNFKALADFDYLLPPLEEQRKIVNVLNNVDSIIGKYENLLKNKEQFIKSQFVEMFKEYEKTDLSDIADIIMGQSPNSESYNDNNEGLPFYQGKADYGDKYTITRHWTTQPSKIAEKGYVVMSVRAPVGPVNITSEKCCIGRGLCAINSKENITNNEFLYNSLNAMQNEIECMGTGSTFKAITKADVYKIQIPNAPIELQNKFAKIVEQVDKQKFELEKIIENYKKLKKGLMQQLLTGKVKVNV